MKNLIVMIMTVCMTLGAVAAGDFFSNMSKDQLADYEITITQKSTGKVVGRMSRAEYKVVRIGSESVQTKELKSDLESERRITKGMENTISDQQQEIENNKKPYASVILHAGVGKKGLSNSLNGGEYEVAEKDGFVAGATLCGTTDKTGLCGTALTNKTFLLGLKLDFK